MSLQNSLKNKKKIRAIGFDDAPFRSERGSPVHIAGVVCSDTRFEGMLWGEIEKDGTNATEVLTELIKNSKFMDQIDLVLIDGLAMGGFNLVDLPMLSEVLKKPCVAVMRRMPNMTKIHAALDHFKDAEMRRSLIKKAGKIHCINEFYFQIAGGDESLIASALEQLTDTGKVPEVLRLAHLIGAAVKTGQSSNRA